MMNLMKDYEIATNKDLCSERARNFQIELVIPPIEKQWHKNAGMQRHGVKTGSKKKAIELPSTNEIKRSRNQMCQRKSSLRAPSRLVITKQESYKKIRRELKNKLKMPSNGD